MKQKQIMGSQYDYETYNQLLSEGLLRVNAILGKHREQKVTIVLY